MADSIGKNNNSLNQFGHLMNGCLRRVNCGVDRKNLKVEFVGYVKIFDSKLLAKMKLNKVLDLRSFEPDTFHIVLS